MKKSLLFLVLMLSTFIGFSQAGDVTFVHTATASNISGSATIIDHPLLNNHPNAKFFITHSIAGDGSITYNDKKSGIHYSAALTKWMIYNEDSSPMLVSSTYNVLIPGTRSDVVEAVSNGGNYWTIIDDAALNDKPNLNPILTHRYVGYQNHNYGMYYPASHKWGILCEDGVTEIPAGEKFFVLAKPSYTGYNVDMSFRFSPTTDDFSNGTYIDHPLLNNHPEAIFFVTAKHPDLFDHTLTTYYRTSDHKWVLISEDTPVTFAGHHFNVVVSMPAPANDLCQDAIGLTVGSDFADNEVEGTLLGSDGGYYGNVWYKVIVPPTGFVTIETAYNAGSTMHDTFMSVYSGNTCSTLTHIVDNDNGGSGNFSKVALSGQTPGSTIYIEVIEDMNSVDPTGSFKVSAYDPSLGIADAVIDGFSMYPNPVENILNIETANPIKAVSIFNVLGQEVINTTQAQIDMSALPSGSYVVKVQAGNQIGAYSLIKQ